MAGAQSYLTYVWAAFKNRWNLLFVGATAALGVIAGRPDVVYPLAGAAEILYLAVLSMQERFRKVVDARELAAGRAAAEPSPTGSALNLLAELSPPDRQRFIRLRDQCAELRNVAEGVKGRAGEAGSHAVTDIQIENINRLLWIYLRLIHTKHSLDKFFRTIDERELRTALDRVQERLKALGPEAEDTPQEVKHRASLADTARTSEMRLKNYEAAKGNYEFIQLELERLETKISGITEMAVNRQDTRFITNEIDVVSTSVMQTERTVHDLESFTGYSFDDAEAPSLLDVPQRDARRVKE